MRFLRLHNYELKINKQSLAHIFPLTCALRLVPRAGSLPSVPDATSAAGIGKEDLAPSWKVLFFPWFDLPGILRLAFFPFSFARKGRNGERWLLTKSRGRGGWRAYYFWQMNGVMWFHFPFAEPF